MFTQHGLNTLLGAWSKVVTGVRFIVGGAVYDEIFPIDAGYPKLGDTDEANDGRGTNVYTWRVTVPKGAGWGSEPATAVELVDSRGTLYKRALSVPFRVSPSNASIFYANVTLERR